jgi:OOP family OmpA-OmpF porin
MTKHRLLVAFGLLAAFFALPASAQLDRSAFYLGGSLGRSHFTDLCANAMPECKDRDTEWSVLGGMQFNRYLGAEIGYRDFGHGTRNGFDYKANASEIDAVGIYPLRGGVGLIGRIGVYHGKLKGGGAEERKSQGTFGWGVTYDFTPTAGMRFEYQRYLKAGGGDLGFETHIDSVSLGAVLRFR